MEAKTKRGANFTKVEVDLLIDISLKFKDIIENKQTDATTWKDKNEAWERICDEFNATSGNFPRSTKTVRAKYDSVKKDIRKKCSIVSNEQKKTGGGPCPGILSPHEEKILSLSRNTMIGLPSRFDADDAEADVSRSGTSITQQDVNEDPLDMEGIEFLDDTEYDLYKNMEISKAISVKKEQPANNVEQGIKRKISDDTSVHESTPRIGTDKFIFRNKRAKPAAQSSRLAQENLELKNELLQLQRSFLLQEIEAKIEMNKLTVENLRLDIQMKKLNIKKLEANIFDDH